METFRKAQALVFGMLIVALLLFFSSYYCHQKIDFRDSDIDPAGTLWFVDENLAVRYIFSAALLLSVSGLAVLIVDKSRNGATRHFARLAILAVAIIVGILYTTLTTGLLHHG